MVGRDVARGVFLVVVAVCASALAVAVYQLPQPWRSSVIIWLLVGMPLLFFVLRVLRHAAHMHPIAPRHDLRAPAAPKPARPSAKLTDLRVVMSDSVGSGRYTIR